MVSFTFVYAFTRTSACDRSVFLLHSPHNRVAELVIYAGLFSLPFGMNERVRIPGVGFVSVWIVSWELGSTRSHKANAIAMRHLKCEHILHFLALCKCFSNGELL